jgi:hypothetical protein
MLRLREAPLFDEAIIYDDASADGDIDVAPPLSTQ